MLAGSSDFGEAKFDHDASSARKAIRGESMVNVWARDRATAFYIGLGVTGLAAVAIGFSTTYFFPMARRSFSAPPIVHIHGALCLAWVSLFIAQGLLVRGRRTPIHRHIGLLALPIALGIFVSGVAVALWAARRDLPTLGHTATSSIIGTVTALTIFVAFVAFAVTLRRRPDWHKRLMLLATIALLWPAVFRFRHLLPFVPQPEIWFAIALADLPILIAAVRDRFVYGKIHPVWAIFGTALVIEQSFEAIAFDSPAWRAVGEWFFQAFG